MAKIGLLGCTCIFSSGLFTLFRIDSTGENNGILRSLRIFDGIIRTEMILFKILLVLLGIAVIFCLSVAVIFLFSMSRENQLPDIEDIEATNDKS